MSRELMIVLIVAIAVLGMVLKARYHARGRGGHGIPDARASGERIESDRLREEVRELKERLAVLERITVEKENSLAREIEDLRKS